MKQDKIVADATTPVGVNGKDVSGDDTEGAEVVLWNNAIIDGDLDSPVAQAVLNSNLTVLMAPNHRVTGDKWGTVSGPVKDLLDGVLTRHPVETEKHGLSLVYADSALTGKATTLNGVRTEYAYRRKDHVCATTAISIDVDGTDKIEALRSRIRELGWFAVIYTTHSHAAKKTAKGDRFRIVLFPDVPFTFPEGRGPERNAAIAAWEAFYVGVCDALELEEIDVSGMRLNQIQHPPRRPSEDAECMHYVIAGDFVKVAEITPGDPTKHKKSAPAYLTKKASQMNSGGGEPLLSDGFNVRDWFYEGGRYVQLEAVMADLGLEDLGVAGQGWRIICSNEAAHTETSDESYREGWACDDFGNDGWAFIGCHHDHCSDMRTWDFIAQWEKLIEEGVAMLPDHFDSLSAMLCAPEYLPDEVDGEPVDLHPSYFGVVEVIEITWLATSAKVKRAFAEVEENDHAGDDHYAALYAGVEKAGNKAKAVERLAELMKASRHDANTLKRLKKRGSDMLAGERAGTANEKEGERRREAQEAIETGTPANTSLDIAEPLGETMEEALATLAHRYVLADMNGKFRVVRKPDLSALRDRGRTLRSVITAQTLDDFKNYHEDRKVLVGGVEDGKLVNPATEFINTAKRKSGVVFAPFPASAGPNEFNMYYGRTLEPLDVTCPTIARFIFHIVCSGRKSLWRWVLLWLAHMAQYPGKKPGTALVLHGAGGCGKSTMGLILDKLSAPHCRILDDPEHVTGRFAGEHLATTICAVCAEAAFAGSRSVVNKLKSLITQPTIQMEPKGLSVMAFESYLRLFFDSNSNFVVAIDRDGSERRYCVMQIAETQKDNKAYFNPLYAAIEGDEMRGFLAWLMTLTPGQLGLIWDDVRSAPSTPERDAMSYQTLRPVLRAMLSIFEDGQVTLIVDGEPMLFTLGGENDRLPMVGLRAYLSAKGNVHNADDSDPVKIMRTLFGDYIEEWPVTSTGQGPLLPGDGRNERFIDFPPREMVVREIGKRFGRVVDG